MYTGLIQDLFRVANFLIATLQRKIQEGQEPWFHPPRAIVRGGGAVPEI